MHYMDTFLILQIILLLGAIFLGVRLGGMAIGYTGGLGVAVLALGLGLTPGHIPHDVILIIMAVIAAIAALPPRRRLPNFPGGCTKAAIARPIARQAWRSR